MVTSLALYRCLAGALGLDAPKTTPKMPKVRGRPRSPVVDKTPLCGTKWQPESCWLERSKANLLLVWSRLVRFAAALRGAAVFWGRRSQGSPFDSAQVPPSTPRTPALRATRPRGPRPGLLSIAPPGQGLRSGKIVLYTKASFNIK